MEHLRPRVRPPWLPRLGGATSRTTVRPAGAPSIPRSAPAPWVRSSRPSTCPARRTTWRYRGSLTTPPCTEGVAWVILTEPLTLSAAQIDDFAAVYPNNYRPVQLLGERVLVRG